MPKPINLAETVGHKYRVFLEDSWKCEPAGEREAAKVWSMELRGKRGFVYPGGNYLVAVGATGKAFADLKRLGLEVRQMGEGEGAFKVGLDRLDEVAGVLGLRKRRQLSQETKKKLVERFWKAGKAPVATTSRPAIESKS